MLHKELQTEHPPSFEPVLNNLQGILVPREAAADIISGRINQARPFVSHAVDRAGQILSGMLTKQIVRRRV